MNEVVKTSAIESALIMNDLSKLNETQRLSYYKEVCESLGLNPLTQPFEYISLNGRLRLYAKRDATEQLRKIHGVSIQIISREKTDDLYIVTAKATDKIGRSDESIGVITIGNLKGDNLANAYMKAETKAKRRATLSICGLGLLDETELEMIPSQQAAESKADKFNNRAVEIESDVVQTNLISKIEIVEMFKLAKENNVSNEIIKSMIDELGFKSSSEITTDAYLKIMRFIETFRDDKTESVENNKNEKLTTDDIKWED